MRWWIVIVVWVLGWNASAQIQVMTPWWTAIGTTDTTELGLSVAGIGDINLDGFDDFAVGTEEKRVWIFLGSAEPDSIPDMFINPHDSIDHKFGEKLSNLGDINGDGEPDLAVYCRYAIGDPATMYSIYFAGAAFDTIPDLLLGKVYIGEDFIVGIGDFNGDGGNDFALGDYTFSNPGQYNDGVMQVFFGGTILDSIPDWQNLTEPPDGYFPKYCTGLGDLNGDGCDEFAVCSPSVKDTIFSEVIGLVEVYYGSSTPDTIPDFRFYGSEDGSDVLGSSIAALDVNGDGYKEMLVRSDRDFPPDYFYSYLIYDLVPEPDSIPDYFLGGTALHVVGHKPTVIDFNGDGWDDLATGFSQTFTGAGSMHVYLFGDEFNESIDLFMYGHYNDCRMGWALANIGDINDDGIEDLAVGEPGFFTFIYQSKWGRIHVVLGDTTYHQSVGVQETSNPIPTSEILLNVYPNPFNSQVTIAFDLPVGGEVALEVFDVFGRRVFSSFTGSETTPTTGLIPSGHHQISIDAAGWSSGIYFVRVSVMPKSGSGTTPITGNLQAMKKVVLVK